MIRLKKLNLFSILYIIGFIAVMYSGSTFLGKQVMPMICLLILLLLVLATVKGVQRGYAYINRKEWIVQFIMLLIVIYLVYQISYSYLPSVTKVFLERFFVYSFLFWIIPTVNLNYRVIQAIRLYSFPVAVSIIITTILNDKKSGGLVGSFQFAGMMMSISFGVFLISFYLERKTSDILGLILCFLAMLMSGKRAFTMMSVVFYFLMALIHINDKKNKRKKFLLLTALIVISLVFSYVLFPEVRLVFERFQKYAGDSTYNGRIYFWRAAKEIFLKNKLLGIGMGSFSEYFDQFFHRLGNMNAMDAHNVYIQIGAEMGIIGLVLFGTLFLYALLSTLNLLRNSYVKTDPKAFYVLNYSIFIQCWFLIYCLSGNPLYGAGQCFFYISGVAMMLSVRRFCRQTKIEAEK